MATPIRGETDSQTKMLLGQIRNVFDPMWIQAFEGSPYKFMVAFTDDTDARDELVRFAEMYGFELVESDNEQWAHYYFGDGS